MQIASDESLNKKWSSCDLRSCSSHIVATFASLSKIQLGLQSWNNVSLICSLQLFTPVSSWSMKQNCLEFNKLQRPEKTTVHSLNSIFCVTANHKFAQSQKNLLLKYCFCILHVMKRFSVQCFDKLTGLNFKNSPMNCMVFKYPI